MRTAIIILAAVAMVGCEKMIEAPAIVKIEGSESGELVRTETWGAWMYTIRHDGHMWVVASGNGKAIAHHPDCPCGKAGDK